MAQTVATPTKARESLAAMRVRASKEPQGELAEQIGVLDDLKAEVEAELAEPLKAVPGRIDELEKRIAEQNGLVERMADDLRRSTLPYVGGYARTGNPEKDFNFGRAVRGHYFGRWEKGPERDMLQATGEYVQRTQMQGTDNVGGFAIPQQVMDQWVDVYWPSEILGAAGVEIIGGNEGLVKWVRVKNSTKPDVPTVNEAAASTKQTINLEELELTPKLCASYALITRELVSKQGGAKFGSWIEKALRKAAMMRLQKLALIGSGGAGEPTGLFTAINANSSQLNDWTSADFAGDNQTVTDELLATEGILEDADALDGNLRYVMSPKTRRKLVGVKDADGRLLFQSGMAAPDGRSIRTLFGYPYHVTSQLATGESTEGRLMFGNFDDFKVLTWGAGIVSFRTIEGFKLASERLEFLGVAMEMNCIALREQSFVSADNLTL